MSLGKPGNKPVVSRRVAVSVDGSTLNGCRGYEHCNPIFFNGAAMTSMSRRVHP